MRDPQSTSRSLSPLEGEADTPVSAAEAEVEALRQHASVHLRAVAALLERGLEQRAALQAQIAGQQQQLASLALQRQQTEDALQAVRSEVAPLNQEETRLRAESAVLQEQVRTLQERHGTLTRELEQMQQHQADLQQRLVHARTELAQPVPAQHRGWLVVRSVLALVVFVIFCGLLALLTDLPTRVGWWVLPVTTSALETSVPQGSVAILHAVPVTAIQPTDVIGFVDSTTAGQPVLGRVLSVDLADNQIILGSRSDAAGTQSAWSVSSGQLVQRVVVYLPRLGVVQSWLQATLTTSAAQLTVIALTFLVLVLLVWPWGSRSAPRS